MNLFVTSLMMTFINILIVAMWKSRQAFRAYGWGNMPLQAVKLPRSISHNNVVGENTVLQLNILESGVLDFVSLEMNSEPLVWEHQSPKCFGGEPTILSGWSEGCQYPCFLCIQNENGRGPIHTVHQNLLLPLTLPLPKQATAPSTKPVPDNVPLDG